MTCSRYARAGALAELSFHKSDGRQGFKWMISLCSALFISCQPKLFLLRCAGVGNGHHLDRCCNMSAFATLDSRTADVVPRGKVDLLETGTDGARALEAFLVGVERRAFRIAQIALSHEADALDVVQDAMIQLSTRYANRPAEEWKPLFYRILQNRIRDVQRRRSVRNRVMALMPWRGEDSEDEVDPIAQAVDKAPLPPSQLEGDEMLQALQQALTQLPPRQREAFLLRNFEGLDVADTAAAMKCSQGSVKTHYFRALQALRSKLGDFRP
jgi:RNA polymerase sigma-70 factor, ECF subfamily